MSADDMRRALELVSPEIVEKHGGAMGLAFAGIEHRGPTLAHRLAAAIEAREGVTTGISAADRAHTILSAVADDAKPADLVSPGHVFPLKAVPGGVLQRKGHTEGSVDLSRLPGLKQVSVI